MKAKESKNPTNITLKNDLYFTNTYGTDKWWTNFRQLIKIFIGDIRNHQTTLKLIFLK